MNKLKRFLLLLAFALPSFAVQAQEGLNIEKIFDDYGKQKGSTLIELAKDVLGNHTKISRYKSLIIPADSSLFNATRLAILDDFVKHSSNGVVLMESKKDGKVEAATYSLGKIGTSSTYEYILFTHKARKMTLIYIKGNFSPEQLDSELKKLKDLFIKVNNKQIKL
jgi:hypothetical protein